MKNKITLFIFIPLAFWCCSTTQHSTEIESFTENDPVFKNLPFIQGYTQVNDLVLKHPYEIPLFRGELSDEGVVMVLVKVSEEGLPSVVKIVEHVSRFADSLAMNYLLGSSYYPSRNITNIDGPYVLEFLLPFYNTQINLMPESENLDTSKVEIREYDTPPEPVGGYTAIQRAVQYPKVAFENGIEGTVIVG